MKRLSALLFLAFLSLPVQAQSPSEMDQDAKQLHALYNEVNAIQDFRLNENGTGLAIGQNAAAYEKALKGLHATERLQQQHSDFLLSFRNKYAPGEQDYTVSRVLTEKFENLALGFPIGLEFNEIQNHFGWLEGAARKDALSCLAQVRMEGTDQGYLKGLNELYRVRAVNEAQQLLEVAPLFAPGDEVVTRRVEELRPQVKATLAKFQAEERKALAGGKWVRAAGPNLSGAALAYVRSLPDWGGNTRRGTKILKVTVTGDWFVAERNLFGQPTKYGLPAAIAAQDNTMAPGVVHCFDVSLITAGPQKSASFGGGVWVGRVWRMYAKNLPR